MSEDFDLTPGTEETTEPAYSELSPPQVSSPPEAAIAPAPRSALRILKGILAVVAGLIIPGLGHLVLGKWGRAIISFVSVAAMFAIGAFWMEGRLYQPAGNDLVSIFPFVANAGLGGIYLSCFLTRTAFDIHAEAATYEYGNTFLFVAGLLNYLIMLDAYDIAVGKKS